MTNRVALVAVAAVAALLCMGCVDLFFSASSILGEYIAYGSGTEVATEWAGVVLVLQEGGIGKFVRADNSEEPFDYTVIDTTVAGGRITGIEVSMPSGRTYGLDYDHLNHFSMWVSDTVTAVILFSKR